MAWNAERCFEYLLGGEGLEVGWRSHGVLPPRTDLGGRLRRQVVV